MTTPESSDGDAVIGKRYLRQLPVFEGCFANENSRFDAAPFEAARLRVLRP